MYKNYTLTYADGGRCGGKYRNEGHAREVSLIISPNREITSIEQRSLFSPEEKEEMDRDKAYHRAY
jgi:hypothetical protein